MPASQQVGTAYLNRFNFFLCWWWLNEVTFARCSKKKITVSSFCLIIRAYWSLKWKLFWSSESQQEANTQPWGDWKSEIQTLEQLLNKGIVLETVTDCLELEKKLSHMTTPTQVPDTCELTHKTREKSRKLSETLSRQQNYFKFFPRQQERFQLISILIDCFWAYL